MNDANDADWRAMRRLVEVLQANMATKLAEITPAGLTCEAPDARAYFILPTIEAIRRNTYDVFPVSVSVHPSSSRVRNERSRGTGSQSQPQSVELTIAVRVLDQVAPDYTESWKTLIPPEREYRRALVYHGAICDLMDAAAAGPTSAEDPTRIGRDVLDAIYVRSEPGGVTAYKRNTNDPGTWCTSTWRIHQIANIPQQT